MTNRPDRPDLDNELADMTDRLLSGQKTDVSADNRVEALIVSRLHETVSRTTVPDAAFHARLTHRINQEWASAHRVLPYGRRPLPRFAAVAAVVVVLLGITLVMLSESALVAPVQATAVGPISWLFPVIFIGAVVLVGFAIWRRRQ